MATVAPRVVQTDRNVGIPELIGRLTGDSKRLASDEVRLAKLELGESLRLAQRGMLWLALGFGVGVIALVGLTVLLTEVIGTVLIGAAWAGALITGGLEIAVGALLVVVGLRTLKHTDYTLGEAREELQGTVARLRKGAGS